MADIAAVFGWGPDILDPMSIEDLSYWWGKAKARAPGADNDDE